MEEAKTDPQIPVLERQLFYNIACADTPSISAKLQARHNKSHPAANESLPPQQTSQQRYSLPKILDQAGKRSFSALEEDQVIPSFQQEDSKMKKMVKTLNQHEVSNSFDHTRRLINPPYQSDPCSESFKKMTYAVNSKVSQAALPLFNSCRTPELKNDILGLQNEITTIKKTNDTRKIIMKTDERSDEKPQKERIALFKNFGISTTEPKSVTKTIIFISDKSFQETVKDLVDHCRAKWYLIAADRDQVTLTPSKLFGIANSGANPQRWIKMWNDFPEQYWISKCPSPDDVIDFLQSVTFENVKESNMNGSISTTAAKPAFCPSERPASSKVEKMTEMYRELFHAGPAGVMRAAKDGKINPAHFIPTLEGLKNYEQICRKEENQLKPFRWPYHAWQIALIDNVLNDDAATTRSDRTIIFLVDPIGKVGKSKFSAYLSSTRSKEFQTLSMMMKENDFFHKARTDVKTYLIDIPRADYPQQLHLDYSLLETLKNGVWTNGKYHGNERLSWEESPNVVVFLNDLPNMSAFSHDKYELYFIPQEVDGCNLIALPINSKIPSQSELQKKRAELFRLDNENGTKFSYRYWLYGLLSSIGGLSASEHQQNLRTVVAEQQQEQNLQFGGDYDDDNTLRIRMDSVSSPLSRNEEAILNKAKKSGSDNHHLIKVDDDCFRSVASEDTFSTATSQNHHQKLKNNPQTPDLLFDLEKAIEHFLYGISVFINKSFPSQSYKCPAKELIRKFTSWCQKRQLIDVSDDCTPLISQNKFGRMMTKVIGYQRVRNRQGERFFNVCLTPYLSSKYSHLLKNYSIDLFQY